MVAVDKVTAFVTREQSVIAQLLVIRHPAGDSQLPAGTVEMGESPDDAVIKKVNEETGIDHSRIVTKLSRHTRTLPDNLKIVTRMSKIFSEPSFDSSSEGFGIIRGTTVEILAERDAFVEIVTDSLGFGQNLPERGYGVRGYIRKSLLTSKIHQHMYHIILGKLTPDSWPIYSDRINLQLQWVPLQPKTKLNPTQSQWLELVYLDLLASHKDSQ